MNKLEKEIYAKYGIKTAGNKLVSPIGNIMPPLKEGNTKTGKKVLTFSILPTDKEYKIDVNGKDYAIKGTCVCHCDGCYATKGNYRYSNTIRSLAINTILANEHLPFLKKAISAQLEIAKEGEIRIHAAGDFNTKNPEEYANMWHEVAKENNPFLFWTYTKIKKYETLFDDLDNANIVKSVIPGVGFNFGHCDYIINAYHTLKALGKSVYICKCGFDDEQHCEGCKVCSQYEYVLFLEHSTSYKGKDDPLYNKLYNIVMNQ